MVQDLRQIIRGILIEELAAHGVSPGAQGKPGVREELVSIQSDRDLAGFVDRVLRMARDNASRADIESGRLVFRLAHPARRGPPGDSRADDLRPGTSRTESFSKGLITETQVHQLPADVKVVRLGKNAVLTPLAKDAIRQAGIKVERTKT